MKIEKEKKLELLCLLASGLLASGHYTETWDDNPQLKRHPRYDYGNSKITVIRDALDLYKELGSQIK